MARHTRSEVAGMSISRIPSGANGSTTIALTELHGTRNYLMANCLQDIIGPILRERERAEYSWVLASEYPDAPGHLYEGPPEMLSGHPEVDAAELREDILALTPGKYVVSMKRVKKQ
jgi:hypothetical protein